MNLLNHRQILQPYLDGVGVEGGYLLQSRCCKKKLGKKMGILKTGRGKNRPPGQNINPCVSNNKTMLFVT